MSLSTWWLTNQSLIEVVIIYALVAFSIQVSLRAGTFSLASLGFYAVGSYTAANLVKEGQPAVLAIAAGVVLSGVIGWLLAMLLVRLRDLYLGMATIAFDLMVGVLALNWVAVTGGPAGMYGIPIKMTAGTMLLILLVVVVLLGLLQRGTIGRTFEVTREDEQLARTAGINTRRYRRFAFVLSAMLGALAGAMHALTFSVVSPGDAGFSFVILALAMVIIGGFGSWVGALIGAIVLAYLPQRLTGLGDTWPIIYGSVLILVATFLPGGFYALARRGVVRARRSVRRPRRPEGSQPPGNDIATTTAGAKAAAL